MCGHDYPPRQVQIEIGFSQSQFHYKSPLFDVAGGGDHEQEFFLLPHFVLGTHFRLNLIGKPFKQDGMDDKYYQALRYVGVAGRIVDSIPTFSDLFCSMA